MKLSWFVTILLAVPVFTGSVESRAQMGPGPGMMRGRMMERGEGRCFGDSAEMRRNLNLSDKQMEEIGRINEKYRGMLMEHRNRLLPKKEELRKTILREDPDFGTLRNLLKEISDIEVEIRLIRIRQRVEIEKVFNPSQKERLRRERRMNWD